jgi:hypothetical protein
MAISIHHDGLAADSAALVDWWKPESPHGYEPPGADSVSAGVHAQLSAHSASLIALMNHGYEVSHHGGVALGHANATLRVADENGAVVLGGNASMSGAVPTPMTSAAAPAPVLPGIPSLPPPATTPGEAQAIALHSGPGSATLRAQADSLLSHAVAADNVAVDRARTSASIDANWLSDSGQQAGANTALHGTWWSGLAGYARALASAHNEAADNFDRAKLATPDPSKFHHAHQKLANAKTPSQVSAAAAFLAQLQAQAAEAAAAYHTASAATTGLIPGTPPSASPIAPGSSSAPASTGTPGNAAQTVSSLAQQLAANPNAVLPGAAASAGSLGQSGLLGQLGSLGQSGSLGQIAQTALPALAMLPMMGMMPLSALSGLAGQSQNQAATTMATSAGLPDVAAQSGLGADMADTLPAVDGAADVAQSLPMAGPAPHLPPAVSGPASSFATSAEVAATAPAGSGAIGGGGMPYAPMMGGPGGDLGPQRNAQLFPDRRMVARLVPNTEAVFGELERERRPRGKRAKSDAKPEEGTNEG